MLGCRKHNCIIQPNSRYGHMGNKLILNIYFIMRQQGTQNFHYPPRPRSPIPPEVSFKSIYSSIFLTDALHFLIYISEISLLYFRELHFAVQFLPSQFNFHLFDGCYEPNFIYIVQNYSKFVPVDAPPKTH